MKRTFEIKVGIAALVLVRELPDERPVAAIYLSSENGILYDSRTTGWPTALKEEISKHFNKVFSLPHETYLGKGVSPRAVYVDNLQPWTIEIEEE